MSVIEISLTVGIVFVFLCLLRSHATHNAKHAKLKDRLESESEWRRDRDDYLRDRIWAEQARIEALLDHLGVEISKPDTKCVVRKK